MQLSGVSNIRAGGLSLKPISVLAMAGSSIVEQKAPGTCQLPGQLPTGQRLPFACEFNETCLPDDLSSEEQEIHIFLDKIGLNQVNLKESLQSIGEKTVAINLSSCKPSFMQRRANRMKDLNLTSKTPSTNCKDIGIPKLSTSAMTNLNLGYKKKQHSDINL